MADATMLSSWYDSYKKDNSAPASMVTAAPQAQVTEWKPDTNATVQGQLGTMLKTGGPLMDRATTRAAQETNKRGLLNSSIGAVNVNVSVPAGTTASAAARIGDTGSRVLLQQFLAGADRAYPVDTPTGAAESDW